MYRLLPVLIWSLPSIALAVGTTYSSARTPSTFCELVQFVVNILNGLTALMVLAALVAYLYGIFWHLKDTSEASRTKLRNVILWGFVGLFVMVSIWGILRVLQATFFIQSPSGTAEVC